MPSKHLLEKEATPVGINIYTPCSFEPIGFPEFKALATDDIARLSDDIVNPLGINGLGETGSLCRLQSPMRSITQRASACATCRSRSINCRVTGEIATLASLLRVRYGRLTLVPDPDHATHLGMTGCHTHISRSLYPTNGRACPAPLRSLLRASDGLSWEAAIRSCHSSRGVSTAEATRSTRSSSRSKSCP
jgi:hypothetical protein